MGQNTIDSNVVGVSIAEETTPKVLPGAPVWFNRAVNSYADFGGDIATVAADTINPSRQSQRGAVVDLDAAGGYNIDMKNGFDRDMQGFLFADAHEHVDTAPLNGTAIPITSTTAAAYKAAAGLDAFAAGQIVLASGFTSAANNGVSNVTTAVAATLTTDNVKVVEASPPAAARVQVVGFKFGSGDLALTVSGGLATLTSTASAWANLTAQIGEWLFIGGDGASDAFGNGYGYGRVKSKTNSVLVLDCVAWSATVVADTGAGKTIAVFIGKFIRNEKDPALIKTRTFQIERTLGSDANGVQSEYLTGTVNNELTFNLPVADKHTADFGYIALDNETRDGTTGVKSGSHVEQAAQVPYNTSSSVFRLSLTILDDTTLEPTALFAYASDATLTINNNASAAKAIGTLGGFDVSIGSFKVGGAITAYFQTVASIAAIRDNSDIGFNAILAQNNTGLVYDVPLLGVGGGKLSVEKDKPVTIPVENFGAENANGYTMSFTSFDYLPTLAMPT